MNQTLDEHAELLENVFGLIMLTCYGTAVLVFTAMLLLMIAARSLFHPLFCLLFSLIIAGYITCNGLTIISMLLNKLGYLSPEVYMILGAAYQAAYIYLSCIVTYCVLERFFATVFSKTYEFRRNWFVLLLGQVIAGLIIFAHIHVYQLGGIISDMVQLALSCVVLTSLSVLLVVNRHISLSTRGQRSLSFRYQVSENVRALRLVTPVVLLDTSVTVADMIGTLFFNVRPAFESDVYKSTPNYLPAYIVLRMSAVVLQYGIPIVIVRHESLRKFVCGPLRRVFRTCARAQVEEAKDVRITSKNHQAIYFDYIHNQWTK